MDMFGFIERSGGVGGTQELFDLLVAGGAELGFDRIAYGALNYKERLRTADCAPQAVILNYPLDWQKSYAERRDYEIDPIVLYASQMNRPFRWRALVERNGVGKRQRAFLAEAEDAGLRDGVSVPIHGADSKVSLICFAASQKGTDSEANMRRLSVLANQFQIAFSELSRENAPPKDLIQLSERERDCLNWTALGKSSWEIGAILAISDNTVNFHIKSAMRKFDTSSRTVAVIKAIRLGLVEAPA